MKIENRLQGERQREREKKEYKKGINKVSFVDYFSASKTYEQNKMEWAMQRSPDDFVYVSMFRL